MGDDSNLHFASQRIFFEFLATGHKKRRGEGEMHRFLVAVYCDPKAGRNGGKNQFCSKL